MWEVLVCCTCVFAYNCGNVSFGGENRTRGVVRIVGLLVFKGSIFMTIFNLFLLEKSCYISVSSIYSTGPRNLFCKRPDSKFFGPCGLQIVSVA